MNIEPDLIVLSRTIVDDQSCRRAVGLIGIVCDALGEKPDRNRIPDHALRAVLDAHSIGVFFESAVFDSHVTAGRQNAVIVRAKFAVSNEESRCGLIDALSKTRSEEHT